MFLFVNDLIRAKVGIREIGDLVVIIVYDKYFGAKNVALFHSWMIRMELISVDEKIGTSLSTCTPWLTISRISFSRSGSFNMLTHLEI